MPIWSILVVVAGGILAGSLAPGRFSAIFGPATLYVFLPALLFEAAWNLDARLLRDNWRPVFFLAVPGVLVTCALVGFGVHLAGVPWIAAFLTGAMLSATDPVAIVAMFKLVPVPPPLSTIVQSEALLNDAVAVSLYSAVLAAAAAGTFTGVAQAAGSALAGGVLGVMTGIAFAVAVALLVIRRRNTLTQFTATLVGAYAAYLTAGALHLSPLFAVIAFGIALREIERRSLSVEVAQGVERGWDRLALLSNIAVFFLTGAAVNVALVAGAPLAALCAIVAIAVARLVLAYGPIPLPAGAGRKWRHVIASAGARGALSLALALALPLTIAGRTTIIDVTLAAVLAALCASAFAIPRAARAAATI